MLPASCLWLSITAACHLLALQEIIASFSFQAKVNLSAIKRIYSSLLWHFEQVSRQL
jgi:hypothetical protein